MGQLTTDLLGDGLVHPYALGGDVPGSRKLISSNIDTLTLNGALEANLTADITLDVVCSGTGPVVGSDRLISGTLPVRINGGASHDLSADIVISVNDFAGTTPGLVPLGTGDPALFLSQAGWASGAVAGVASITGTAPIVVSPTTGAAIASISPANLTTPGSVPAVGAVNSAHALLRTNPPTWGLVGLSGFVELQLTYPGSAQTGSAHVTGVIGAQSAIVAGSNKKSLNGIGLEQLYVKQSGPSNHPVVASYYSLGGPINPGMIFRAARGTEAIPVDVSNNDDILRIVSERRVAAGWQQREVLSGVAHSSGGFSMRMNAYGSTTATNSFIYLGPNALGGVNTVAPLSGWDVGTSFGLKASTMTGSSPSGVATADTETVYLCDATASAFTFQLLTIGTAAGRGGRITAAIKVDATSKPIQIMADGGSLIGGQTSIVIPRRGDGVILISDNTNWQILSRSASYERFLSAADGTALVNTVTEGDIYDMANPDLAASQVGIVARMYGYGKFSTNGTPTLRFRVKNASGDLLADSGALTMPSTLTNAIWQLDYIGSCRANINNEPRFPVARLYIGQAAGAGAEMKCYNLVDLAITGAGFVTGSIPRKLTGQWGTAHANNSITCLSMVRAQTDSTTLV